MPSAVAPHGAAPKALAVRLPESAASRQGDRDEGHDDGADLDDDGDEDDESSG